jgi:tetratricopeptide (TPR) repeat protein
MKKNRHLFAILCALIVGAQESALQQKLQEDGQKLLAAIQQMQNDLRVTPEAEDVVTTFVQGHPQIRLGWHVLSSLRQKQGRLDEAVSHIERVIGLPGQQDKGHWQTLASLLEQSGPEKHKDAITATYEKIIHMFPDTIAGNNPLRLDAANNAPFPTLHSLADVAKEKLGIEDEGANNPQVLYAKGVASEDLKTRMAYFEKVRSIAPNEKWLAINMALALPRVYSSMEDLLQWRKILTGAAARVEGATGASDISPSQFFIVYQGANDVELVWQIQRGFLGQNKGLDRVLVKSRDEGNNAGKIKVRAESLFIPDC